MSRIGLKPVLLPTGVEVKTVNTNKGLTSQVEVKGPKGVLFVDLTGEIVVKVEEGKVLVERKDDVKANKSLHGLYRSLIQNAVIGVTEGYKKQLEIQGIGYKAELNGADLSLKLGYSHPIIVTAPKGIVFEVKDGTLVTISGNDKQMVGQLTAKIRSQRKPEPYKGKGIRYVGEQVKRKAGKAAAATKAA